MIYRPPLNDSEPIRSPSHWISVSYQPLLGRQSAETPHGLFDDVRLVHVWLLVRDALPVLLQPQLEARLRPEWTRSGSRVTPKSRLFQPWQVKKRWWSCDPSPPNLPLVLRVFRRRGRGRSLDLFLLIGGLFLLAGCLGARHVQQGGLSLEGREAEMMMFSFSLHLMEEAPPPPPPYHHLSAPQLEDTCFFYHQEATTLQSRMSNK